MIQYIKILDKYFKNREDIEIELTEILKSIDEKEKLIHNIEWITKEAIKKKVSYDKICIELDDNISKLKAYTKAFREYLERDSKIRCIEYICKECGQEISPTQYEDVSGNFCPECGGNIEENTDKVWCFTGKNGQLMGPFYNTDLCKTFLDKEIHEETDIFNLETLEWKPLTSWDSLKSVTKAVLSAAKEEPATNISDVDAQTLLLGTCESCSHKFSKRAEACPKCGRKPQAMCQICQQKIPFDSIVCPECGDPMPFELQEKTKQETFSTGASLEVKEKIRSEIEINSRERKYHYIKDPSFLTKFLKVMLWVSLGISIISLLSDFMQMKLLSSVTFSQAAAERNDSRQQIMGILYLVAFIVTGISFLRWIHRANSNCHGFGAQKMEFTPGWSVGYYFIPFINLYKPYRAMKEIWKVSTNPTNWQNERGSALLGWWWALWLISNLLGQVTFRMSIRADTLSSMQASTTVAILSEIIDIPLYIIAISIISAIFIKQEKLVN